MLEGRCFIVRVKGMFMSDRIRRNPNSPPPPPLKYAGEWIAWDETRSTVVAHGKDVAKVFDEAVAAGHPKAIIQKVRRPGTIFIGRSA